MCLNVQSVPYRMVIVLILVFAFNAESSAMHPVHVSVLNMDIHQKQKEVVMSFKVFIDDLETMLHNKYGIHGWIGSEQEYADSRKLIVDYVKEQFSININNSEWVSLEADSAIVRDDALWIYMKGRYTQSARYMEINNSILTDFFDNQANLVIINTGDKEVGERLTRKKQKIQISL